MLNFKSYGAFLVGLLAAASSQVFAIKIEEDFSFLTRHRSISSGQSLQAADQQLETAIFTPISKTQRNQPVSKNESKASISAFMEMRTRIGTQQNDSSGFYTRFNKATQEEPISSVQLISGPPKTLTRWGTLTSSQINERVQGFKRPWLVPIFKETVEEIQKDSDFVPELNEALQKTKILDVDAPRVGAPSSIFNNIPQSSPLTTVSVRDENVIQTIENVIAQGKTPVVLNLGNARDPMGGAWSGSMAQEEELARCSTLSQINFPLAAARYYPLSDSGTILTEGVTLVRKGSEDGYQPFLNATQNKFDRSRKFVSITSAAYNVNPDSRKKDVNFVGPSNAEARIEGTSKKILTQFQALQEYVQNHQNQNIVFILGAFGCGAFGNDANEIVSIYNYYFERFAGLVPEAIFTIKGINGGRDADKLKPFLEFNGQVFEPQGMQGDAIPKWQDIQQQASNRALTSGGGQSLPTNTGVFPSGPIVTPLGPGNMPLNFQNSPNYSTNFQGIVQPIVNPNLYQQPNAFYGQNNNLQYNMNMNGIPQNNYYPNINSGNQQQVNPGNNRSPNFQMGGMGQGNFNFPMSRAGNGNNGYYGANQQYVNLGSGNFNSPMGGNTGNYFGMGQQPGNLGNNGNFNPSMGNVGNGSNGYGASQQYVNLGSGNFNSPMGGNIGNNLGMGQQSVNTILPLQPMQVTSPRPAPIPFPTQPTQVPPPAQTTQVTSPAPTVQVAPPAQPVRPTPPAQPTQVNPPAQTTQVTPPAPTAQVTPPTLPARAALPAQIAQVTPPAQTVQVAPPAQTAQVTPPTQPTQVTPPALPPRVTPPVQTTHVAPPALPPQVNPPTLPAGAALPAQTAQVTPPAQTVNIILPAPPLSIQKAAASKPGTSKAAKPKKAAPKAQSKAKAAARSKPVRKIPAASRVQTKRPVASRRGRPTTARTQAKREPVASRLAKTPSVRSQKKGSPKSVKSKPVRKARALSRVQTKKPPASRQGKAHISRARMKK